MIIKMPEAAKMIIEKLNNAGYEAYIVGGCVRDCLLGKEPNDWDITTSAMPEEVKAIFKRTVDTGIQHGTVTVMVDKEGYEVTTYRVDGEYKDHRRPERVEFTRSLTEDLKRRDFTINAMAYNDENGVIDIFGGQEDLKKGIIRCVGNPDDRFDEDALRILRAVRFAAQLGFVIDEATEKAISGHAGYLKDISAERIQVELTKLLISSHTERLEDAYRLGITAVILPEFDRMMETKQNNPHHMYDVGHHTLKVIENVPATVVMRYTALLHDSGKPVCKTTGEDGIDHFYGHNKESEKIAEKVLRRLKLDNNTIRDVKKLVYWHDYGIGGGISIKSFRKALSKLDPEYFERLIAVRRGDMMGQSDFNKDKKEQSICEMQELYEQIMRENQCLKLKDLKINGKDLMKLGVSQGELIGKILNTLFEAVLEKPELNDERILREMAQKILEKQEKV